jgi:hypothetical protein
VVLICVPLSHGQEGLLVAALADQRLHLADSLLLAPLVLEPHLKPSHFKDGCKISRNEISKLFRKISLISRNICKLLQHLRNLAEIFANFASTLSEFSLKFYNNTAVCWI